MIDLIIILVLLWMWYGFWTYAEKKHFKRIIQDEKELRSIVVLWKKQASELSKWNIDLYTWNIVLSSDYFKRFIAWFINFFWGRMKVYESLLDRARRDTIVKVKKQAKAAWYNAIANLRIETSSISKWNKWKIWSIEVLAYATGIKI